MKASIGAKARAFFAQASEKCGFAPYEWMMAGRYLRARKSSGFVSVIAGFSFAGIGLGVATLIVVMSVMNGFHKELLDKIVGINGHIFVQAADRPLSDYREVVQKLAKIPGVELALPMVEGAAGVSSQYAQSGGLVRGVREADLKRLPGIANNVRIGTLDDFDQSKGVAIGKRMAETLSLREGDSLTILTARGAQTPFGVTPRIKTYPIKAIFQIGMSEFDNRFVYMPLAEAQAFFNGEDDVSVVEVFLKNPDAINKMRDEIGAALGPDYLLTDWRQRNETFFNVLKVERNVMFIILTLIVLVAALNIISGLIMLVKDKTRDVAIMRTMGATRNAVMRIFLITGTSIGVAGTFAGFLLGLFLANNLENLRSFLNYALHINTFPEEVYFLSHLPAVVDPWEVFFIVLMTLTLSVLASLYPAYRAASLDPVEGLRYE